MNPATELLAAARLLDEQGLNAGTAGNCSIRVDSGFLVTPSAVPVALLDESSMVRMDMAGDVIAGGVPSSEWRFHRDIYLTYPSAAAIVHTHSAYATALACLREPLPPFHYMVAKAGGHDVPCTGFSTYGTQALSDAVVTALRDRRACLMANHGMVAYGSSMDAALGLAVDVEQLCRQYLIARSVGTPVLLSTEEMDEAIARFAGYGKAHR